MKKKNVLGICTGLVDSSGSESDPVVYRRVPGVPRSREHAKGPRPEEKSFVFRGGGKVGFIHINSNTRFAFGMWLA